MKNSFKILSFGVVSFALLAAGKLDFNNEPYYSISDLKKLYSSGDPSTWPKPTLDSTVVNFREIGVLPEMTFPEDNLYSDEKRDLGKQLFFDPRLSASGQIACASCHDSQLGWSDGKRVSHGFGRTPGTRNSKTILNVGYGEVFMWDGRAISLEDQVRFPMEDVKEMNTHPDVATKNIKKIKGYKEAFAKAFGDDEITLDRIAKAIATYERTIVSRKSKFDKFIEGDSTKLSDLEVEGLHLFRTKARCINCHNGPTFSDNQFHNAGLTYFQRKHEDLGRYHITKDLADIGKFKTPSLRDLESTAPYMHNGFFPHIRGLLNLYNAGMPNLKPKPGQEDDPMFPVTSEHLKPLELNEHELDALEAFLKSLSTTVIRETEPKLPK